jgi:hypothetical protein
MALCAKGSWRNTTGSDSGTSATWPIGSCSFVGPSTVQHNRHRELTAVLMYLCCYRQASSTARHFLTHLPHRWWNQVWPVSWAGRSGIAYRRVGLSTRLCAGSYIVRAPELLGWLRKAQCIATSVNEWLAMDVGLHVLARGIWAAACLNRHARHDLRR